MNYARAGHWIYAQNVKAYYNSVISLDGETDLIASTLWAHIPPPRLISRNMELPISERFGMVTIDCHGTDSMMSTTNVWSLSERVLNIATPEQRLSSPIMCRHSTLWRMSFKGSLINGAFTSDLNCLMESLPIDYWIYGHSHRNIDREIGGVKCVSNQLGYVFSNEHGDFKRDKIIEV